ncbi:acyl-CoA N-acyltransferase [Roridomyces roridus]|uniref:Acyl-CoA N-acyltransferase n=1 Tax=Roridomyces roridus TaxID=1738132 RepID=A0AAD7G322_9AGAR|nr:acyl-CoA N-acyltransferase [Roridomyces roridus]
MSLQQTPPEYRIRQYRNGDMPQIRALLYEGFVTSKGSVVDVATRRALTGVPCIIAYCIFLGGAFLLLRSPSSSTLKAVGTSLMVLSTSLLLAAQAAIRRYATRFCDEALENDLHDINAHCINPGGGFWVAVREERVLGYVGLAHWPSEGTTEIRRMVVTEAFRHRGIARALMDAARAHSDAIHNVQCVYVRTTDLQKTAQRLYERLGFVPVQEETIGNWAGRTVRRLYKRTVDGRREQ